MNNWMGNCSNPSYFDQGSCAGHGVWTPGRRIYPQNMPAPFRAYLGLQDDLQIIEMTRYSIYDGQQPTKAQEKTAKLEFNARLATLAGNIIGKTNATTNFTTDQKTAVVKLLMQPSTD